MSFEISVDDVKKYLASHSPEEPVGLGASPKACLVEQALEYKYPGKIFEVTVGTFWNVHPTGALYYGESGDLGAEIDEIIRKFDDISSGWITRAQVEEAIPELKGEANV